MNNSWTVVLEEDENGEVILPFPAELIRKYNWQEGDTISWEILDRSAIITNVSAAEREASSGKVV